MQSISRTELARAINNAIIETGSLTPDQEYALLEVAETADKVARGGPSVSGVGCPAQQAGLIEAGKYPGGSVTLFGIYFDCETMRFATEQTVFEVTD